MKCNHLGVREGIAKVHGGVQAGCGVRGVELLFYSVHLALLGCSHAGRDLTLWPACFTLCSCPGARMRGLHLRRRAELGKHARTFYFHPWHEVSSSENLAAYEYSGPSSGGCLKMQTTCSAEAP